MSILKLNFALFVTVTFLLTSFQIQANSVDIPDIPVLMGAKLINNQNQKYIAVSFENAPKWHTYWKNPGDAGLPIKLEFSQKNEIVKLQATEWPYPQRYLEQGGMWAYGYEGQYSLFYKISPEQLSKLNDKTLTIKGTWLVCKHICIPGNKSLEVKISNGLFSENNSELETTDEVLTKRLNNLPTNKDFPDNLDLVLAKNPKKSGLIIYYNYSMGLKNSLMNNINLLTPFPQVPLTYTHEELYKDKKGNIYGKMPIDWDGEYQEPPVELPTDGKFEIPYKLKFLLADPITQKVHTIEKEFSSFNLTSGEASESFLKLLKKVDLSNNAKSELKKVELIKTEEEYSFIYYLLFAFLGGFILNFMPCVLPVISLKLFGLISHSNESKSRIFKHNIFYSIGVLFSFIVLAITVILLKEAGNYVGWGFQLQSPLFVAGTIIVLFLMTLNLFGVFEIMTPGGQTLGGVELSSSYSGDFFSGVIATILSTPCSAPFLGTALTFAFSSNTFTIIIMFLMIGLGLAFPFILTAFVPSLISFFPKPGNWMNHLKKFLAVTLLLTVVWLFDVFRSQVDIQIQSYKLFFILLLILISFLLKKKINKLGWFSLILPIILFIQFTISPMQNIQDEKTNVINTKAASKNMMFGLLWEKFNEKKLQEFSRDKQLTFIDFTAKWCFTCKVNEKLVLDSDDFRDLVKQHNIKLLLADWTKRDIKIGKWLKDHGKVGVPAYFILDKNGRLHNLGETISINKIKKYF